jgi:hypothetical protein
MDHPPRQVRRILIAALLGDWSGFATQRSICRAWLAIVLLLIAVPSPGQDILRDNLVVVPKLQPLDRLVRKQLETLFTESDAAEAAHGRDSTTWHVASARHDPLTVHGSRLMDYVREHAGTPESLICLSTWSTGAREPRPSAHWLALSYCERTKTIRL